MLASRASSSACHAAGVERLYTSSRSPHTARLLRRSHRALSSARALHISSAPPSLPLSPAADSVSSLLLPARARRWIPLQRPLLPAAASRACLLAPSLASPFSSLSSQHPSSLSSQHPSSLPARPSPAALRPVPSHLSLGAVPLPSDGVSAAVAWLRGAAAGGVSLPSVPSLSSEWSAVARWRLLRSFASLLRFELPKGFDEFLSRTPRPTSAHQPAKDGGASAAAGGEKSDSAEQPAGASGGSSGGGGGSGGPSSGGGGGGRTGGESGDGKAGKPAGAKPPTGSGSGGSSGWPGGLGDPRVALLTVAAVVFLVFVWHDSAAPRDDITFQEFRNKLLDAGKVDRLTVNAQTKTVYVQLKPDSAAADGGGGGFSSSPSGPGQSSPARYQFAIGSVEAFERSLDEAQKELGLDPRDYVSVKYAGESTGLQTASSLLQLGIMIFIIWSISRGMGAMSGGGMGGAGGKGGRSIFSIGKSPATLVKPGEHTKTTFADVAGLDEAKVEVMEFVKFLQAPEQFTRLGAKIPKGALLCGPPGTGKTLLAKAMAGEASVPFFSISGSDFLEMFVGVGPSRVRDLFAQARASAPCIVFIDEIDAVGRSRGKGNFSGGHDERENTLNQLLVEMDGFASTEGVVVLAGTNRKDILDKALLRPGRFDRTITIDKPDLRGRTQIFLVHLKPLKLGHERQDLAQRLAALTPGFAGADIANLCNEAALIAARSNKAVIGLVDFEKAADRVIGGLEKSHSVMSAAEKKRVAYHEAGHAVIGWFLEHADPLLKVTIVPRGSGALGFAQYLPKELALYTQAQLLDMMCMTLGGRAAEQHFFKDVSTGAADDLQKVTRIAQAQISSYGMSTRLGHVSYHHDQSAEGGQFTKPFSEATAQTIDEEVRLLVSTAYDRTVQLVAQHAPLVLALAEKLLAVETVNHDVLVQVLGPRPFVSDAYSQWMNSGAEAAQQQALREEEERRKKAEEEKEARKRAAESGPTPTPNILNPAAA